MSGHKALATKIHDYIMLDKLMENKNKNEFEKILFYSDGIELLEIREWIETLAVQKKRWLGSFHPDSRIRIEALKSSGVEIGKDVFISIGMVVLDDYKNIVTLGDRVAIGCNVNIIAASAPNESVLAKQPEVLKKYIKTLPVSIGDDAWIGAGAVILPGVKVGKRCIVGAGAVIREDVPPDSVIAGIPGRIINTLQLCD